MSGPVEIREIMSTSLVDQRFSQQFRYDIPVFGMNMGTTILAARAVPPPTFGRVMEADRLIGYGAFGVVWAVTDPRTSKQVALKKLLNIFHSLVSCRRAYRELSMMCSLKHENILTVSDVVLPSQFDVGEVYIISELMQSDLHKIIVSSQLLTSDHVKLFTYQILRGLKYLHSANILHRDLKPGNLLVNGDCLLKICDFGLARVAEPDDEMKMTQEVVTQYYRAPEILMGARHYTSAVDIWSAGCIVAELLTRKILFQAPSAIQQLNVVIELLGSPSYDDMDGMCEAAKRHVFQRPFSLPNLVLLRMHSSDCDNEVLHLLSHILVFNPKKRISAADALSHPYLEEGRIRYHACMCKCCRVIPTWHLLRIEDLEPVCPEPFKVNFEDELSSISKVKEKMVKLYRNIQADNEALGIPQLHINISSPFYQSFTKSQCAEISQLPPSPYLWE